MVRNTRPSRFSEIHPEIETLWLVNLGQRRLRGLHEVHHFIGCLFIGLIEIGKMCIRNDQEMPRSVWVNIQNYKIKLGPLEDKVFIIGRRVIENVTENTSARFGGTDARYIV